MANHRGLVMNRKIKLLDIAQALGVSIGTVHRALHNRPGVSPMTRSRALQMARAIGYRPNLAARYLSTKRSLRISVNTSQDAVSFWDDVRAGVAAEARSLTMESVEIEYRSYPLLGEGEEEAFKAALDAGVDGIITFPSRPQNLKSWLRRASRSSTPVVCVATDAPGSGALAVVSIDAPASGSLAADLIGRFLGGKGKVAILGLQASVEHAEKRKGFATTLHSLHPEIVLHDTLLGCEVDSEIYEKSRGLFAQHPNLAAVYVTTEASAPVLQAARDAQILEQITVIATGLLPALVSEIRSGAVAATIHQRPGMQGRMAFRVLYEFLVDSRCPSFQIALAPHLVMRGNLDFFLEQQSNGDGIRTRKSGADAEYA
jgi:LacI family transcriptional regulator